MKLTNAELRLELLRVLGTNAPDGLRFRFIVPLVFPDSPQGDERSRADTRVAKSLRDLRRAGLAVRVLLEEGEHRWRITSGGTRRLRRLRPSG